METNTAKQSKGLPINPDAQRYDEIYGLDGHLLNCTVKPYPCGCEVIGDGTLQHPIAISYCTMHGPGDVPENMSNIKKLEEMAELLDIEWETYETDDTDLDQMYKDMLNEISECPTVGNVSQDPADFLKENDPTAYRCGYSDWLGAELSDNNLIEIGGVYLTLDQFTEAKEMIADTVNDMDAD